MSSVSSDAATVLLPSEQMVDDGTSFLSKLPPTTNFFELGETFLKQRRSSEERREEEKAKLKLFSASSLFRMRRPKPQRQETIEYICTSRNDTNKHEDGSNQDNKHDGNHQGCHSPASSKNEKDWICLDGPPFPTTDSPHLGHVLVATIKDTMTRHMTMTMTMTRMQMQNNRADMSKYLQRLNLDSDDCDSPYVSHSNLPGWDCHGLPIEYMTDQLLQQKTIQQDTKDRNDLSTGATIRSSSSSPPPTISEYNEICRSTVLQNIRQFESKMDGIVRRQHRRRRGRQKQKQEDWKEQRQSSTEPLPARKEIDDHGNDAFEFSSYKTMDTSYMEHVWWIFSRLFEKKLIYLYYSGNGNDNATPSATVSEPNEGNKKWEKLKEKMMMEGEATNKANSTNNITAPKSVGNRNEPDRTPSASVANVMMGTTTSTSSKITSGNDEEDRRHAQSNTVPSPLPVLPWTTICGGTQLSDFEAKLNLKNYRDHLAVVAFPLVLSSSTVLGDGKNNSTTTTTTNRHDKNNKNSSSNQNASTAAETETSSTTFLVVATSAVWTLPSNLAVGVYPDKEYVQIIDKTGMAMKKQPKTTTTTTTATTTHALTSAAHPCSSYILAKDGLPHLYPIMTKRKSRNTRVPKKRDNDKRKDDGVPTDFSDLFEIRKTLKGRDLLSLKYIPPFPNALDPNRALQHEGRNMKRYFQVVAIDDEHEGDNNDNNDGKKIPSSKRTETARLEELSTGIIHLAPAFDEKAYATCLSNNIIDAPAMGASSDAGGDGDDDGDGDGDHNSDYDKKQEEDNKTNANGIIFLDKVIPCCPIGDDGKFLYNPADDVLVQGKFFKEADEILIAWMDKQYNENDMCTMLLRTKTIHHIVPCCWRSDTPLLYRQVCNDNNENGQQHQRCCLFFHLEKIRNQLVQNNDEVRWEPAYVGQRRFRHWLQHEARDWAISRSNRKWGTPIPIWTLIDDDPMMNEVVCIDSIAKLESLSGVSTSIISRKENSDDDATATNLSLHRDVIDQIEIPSQKYPGKMLKRIDDVFDCWFESACMPYVMRYYYEQQEEGQSRSDHLQSSSSEFLRQTTTTTETNNSSQLNVKMDIPTADFIAEGLDQTWGWFYTMFVLSTALTGKPPVRNIIVSGLVLGGDDNDDDDVKRRKIGSSSRGIDGNNGKTNFVKNPDRIVQKYGTDALRLYLINSSAVRSSDVLKFEMKDVEEMTTKILVPWYHSFRYLVRTVERVRRRLIQSHTQQGRHHQHHQHHYQGEESADSHGVLFMKQKLTNITDLWIRTVTQDLIRYIQDEMNEYRLYNVVAAVERYMTNVLDFYVRINSRRRLYHDDGDNNDVVKQQEQQGQEQQQDDVLDSRSTNDECIHDEETEDKLTFLRVLYQSLLDITILMIPFAPFTSDFLIQFLCTYHPTYMKVIGNKNDDRKKKNERNQDDDNDTDNYDDDYYFLIDSYNKEEKLDSHNATTTTAAADAAAATTTTEIQQSRKLKIITESMTMIQTIIELGHELLVRRRRRRQQEQEQEQQEGQKGKHKAPSFSSPPRSTPAAKFVVIMVENPMKEYSNDSLKKEVFTMVSTDLKPYIHSELKKKMGNDGYGDDDHDNDDDDNIIFIGPNDRHNWVSLSLIPNYKVLGRRLGKQLKSIRDAIGKLPQEDVWKCFEEGKLIIDGVELSFTSPQELLPKLSFSRNAIKDETLYEHDHDHDDDDDDDNNVDKEKGNTTSTTKLPKETKMLFWDSVVSDDGLCVVALQTNQVNY